MAQGLICVERPNSVNMDSLYSYANNYEQSNLIDLTSNIQGNRVYIFHGSVDSVVKPGWNLWAYLKKKKKK